MVQFGCLVLVRALSSKRSFVAAPGETVYVRFEPKRLMHEFVTHTLTAALVDWLAYGLFILENGHKMPKKSDITSCKLNIRTHAQALCLCDVRFESANHCHFSAVEADTANNQAMVKCWIKFRTQKNGQKGDEKLIIRKTSGKCLPSCYVSDI
jgi:hypothetical protein